MDKMNRRSFVAATAATAAAGLALSATSAPLAADSPSDKPALLGGKAIRKKGFARWPIYDEREDKSLLDALHSGHWCRSGGTRVSKFEADYAKLTGAKYCLAANSGTSALFTSLSALGIGPGDEVILPPYTFIATANVILLNYALPIFVDSDIDTFQIDAKKIEAAVTDRTALLLPVHLGGNVADLDAILKIAVKHKLPVVEDTCQSHLAEWRGRKAGTFGATGCFSFQGSKNLNCGDGGALLTNDDNLIEKCYAFHANSRPQKISGLNFSSFIGNRAGNLRMTEFQGAVLSAQLTRLEAQAAARQDNGDYLTKLLAEIPGVKPAKMYDGCTRNAYHLYMFRYDSKEFAGLSRKTFIDALGAEGISASSGYGPLNRDKYFENALNSRGYQKIYTKAEIDRWKERNSCPVNDRLCQEAVWFTQSMLLGDHSDMDQIAEAVRKVKAHASELAKM